MPLNRTEPKVLRQFGIFLGAILLMISVAQFFKGNAALSEVIFAVSLAVILTALLRGSLLLPVYIFFNSTGKVLGWVNTRLLLCVVFYGIVTPLGLAAKLFSKQFLSLNKDPGGKSYWIERADEQSTQDYERQF